MNHSNPSAEDIKASTTYRSITLLLLIAVTLLVQAYFLRARLSDQSSLQGRQLKPMNLVRYLPFDNCKPTSVVETFQGARPHFVLFFSPSCPACSQMLPVWRELTWGLTNRGIGVVLLSSREQGAIDVSKYLGLPVLAMRDTSASKVNNLSVTPLTLLVDRTGTVERVWRGAVSANEFEEWVQKSP